MPEPLRLIALDAEDLAIMSAHLQDSLVKVGDMTYLPRSKRFALVARGSTGWQRPRARRNAARPVFHFERVLKVTRTGFDQDCQDANA